MSTLSEQADKLRKVAMETRMSEPVLDEVYMLPNTKVANAMRRAADEMDAAADTILKLSDDLQLVNTENARLIKKVNELDTQINLYVQTTLRAFGLVKENNEVLGSLAEDSIKLQKQGERLFDKTLELSTENAKLRKLARLLLWGIDNDMPRYEELAWTQKVNVLVRELGVEVDE